MEFSNENILYNFRPDQEQLRKIGPPAGSNQPATMLFALTTELQSPVAERSESSC